MLLIDLECAERTEMDAGKRKAKQRDTSKFAYVYANISCFVLNEKHVCENYFERDLKTAQLNEDRG